MVHLKTERPSAPAFSTFWIQAQLDHLIFFLPSFLHRYVNCARNKDETNLLAVQYKGSILFHCCRTIHPGDELLVGPSSKRLARFSEAWTQMWFMKLNAAGTFTTYK